MLSLNDCTTDCNIKFSAAYLLRLLLLVHPPNEAYSVDAQISLKCKCTFFSKFMKVTFQSFELTAQLQVYELLKNVTWLCLFNNNTGEFFAGAHIHNDVQYIE